MSKINEMIKELCPNGVERVKLGECTQVIRGERITKKQVSENGIYPVISGGVTPMGYYDKTNRDENTITVSQYGTAGYVDFQTKKFWANDICYCLLPNEEIDKHFLFYYLKQKQEYLYSIRNTDAVPYSLPSDTLKNVDIPLPPLPIQREIVNILDKFSSLIDNLDETIKLRQKQYEYYREKLLTFKDGECDWKTLGEIGTMHKGKGIQKADFVDNGKPCIHYGQVHTYYGFSATETKSFVSEEMYANSNKAKKGDIIIATTSEDVEACCKSTVWLGESEPAISGDAHFFRHNQNPKYIGYLFMTEMFAAQKRTAAVGAKVTRVHGDSILKFKFPFPSLQYQQEIVATLDKFEAMISNLKQERELRQKQYEYYREKLLTFE